MNRKDPLLERIRAMLVDVHPIIRNIEVYRTKNASHTFGKKRIFINLHDMSEKSCKSDILVHVFLVLVAHAVCPEIGHTDEFYRVVNWLIERATAIGVYSPIDPFRIKRYIQ